MPKKIKKIFCCKMIIDFFDGCEISSEVEREKVEIKKNSQYRASDIWMDANK
jgi:hypothetical protein